MLAAGIRHLTALDDHGGEQFTLVGLYPTRDAVARVQLGPFSEELSADARIAAGDRSMAVISHGTGSWNLLHRQLAARLAQRGYVVALLEHLHNNRNDNRLEDTAENLRNWPRHVSATIDAVVADAALGKHVKRDAVGVIGHSLGAYTALAVAGGTPRFPPHNGELLDVRRDARVAALVLLAPATPWYLAPGALAAVTAPILMLSGERDQIAPEWHADLVARGIPDRTRLTHVRVPNAGHFSFLSAYPPALRRPDLPPSNDPEGFDRIAFQAELAEQVGRFLDDTLPRS